LPGTCQNPPPSFSSRTRALFSFSENWASMTHQAWQGPIPFLQFFPEPNCYSVWRKFLVMVHLSVRALLVFQPRPALRSRLFLKNSRLIPFRSRCKKRLPFCWSDAPFTVFPYFFPSFLGDPPNCPPVYEQFSKTLELEPTIRFFPEHNL